MRRAIEVETTKAVDSAMEDAPPRFPTRPPRHPKEGHAYLDKERSVMMIYVGGEWVQSPWYRS